MRSMMMDGMSWRKLESSFFLLWSCRVKLHFSERSALEGVWFDYRSHAQAEAAYLPPVVRLQQWSLIFDWRRSNLVTVFGSTVGFGCWCLRCWRKNQKVQISLEILWRFSKFAESKSSRPSAEHLCFHTFRRALKAQQLLDMQTHKHASVFHVCVRHCELVWCVMPFLSYPGVRFIFGGSHDSLLPQHTCTVKTNHSVCVFVPINDVWTRDWSACYFFIYIYIYLK